VRSKHLPARKRVSKNRDDGKRRRAVHSQLGRSLTGRCTRPGNSPSDGRATFPKAKA
jgi:hypothetical protein